MLLWIRGRVLLLFDANVNEMKFHSSHWHRTSVLELNCASSETFYVFYGSLPVFVNHFFGFKSVLVGRIADVQIHVLTARKLYSNYPFSANQKACFIIIFHLVCEFIFEWNGTNTFWLKIKFLNSIEWWCFSISNSLPSIPLRIIRIDTYLCIHFVFVTQIKRRNNCEWNTLIKSYAFEIVHSRPLSGRSQFPFGFKIDLPLPLFFHWSSAKNVAPQPTVFNAVYFKQFSVYAFLQQHEHVKRRNGQNAFCLRKNSQRIVGQNCDFFFLLRILEHKRYEKEWKEEWKKYTQFYFARGQSTHLFNLTYLSPIWYIRLWTCFILQFSQEKINVRYFKLLSAE